ncbi:MAG: phosphoglycerate dehydrogenase [Candidatus Thorarchaeota archaeon]
MGKVYITPRSITKNGHPSLKKLENAGLSLIFAKPGIQPTEQDQLDILPECVAYLAGIEPISEKVLKVAKKLRVISRNGVGVENIDIEAAKRLNIEVMIAASSNAQGVAELAISMMFCTARSVSLSNSLMKLGKWERNMGFELEGKTLGVIGCGNIGKRTIRLAIGLNMKVIGYDLYEDTSFHPSSKFRFSTFEELLKESDIISLHCPPSETPLINNNTLAIMKNGVILINTARAAVVNERAVLDALNSGKLRAYATDVYNEEPPKIDALLSHEKVICTPHIGAYTIESIDRAMEIAVSNILVKLNL